MGYFNYFIKCIIRKFVNIFLNPKSMLVILVIIFLLYLLGGTSRAEWSNTQIDTLMEEIQDIYVALIEQLNDLEQVKYNTEETVNLLGYCETRLRIISERLNLIQSYTDDIETQLSSIISELGSVNSMILNIYNTLEENQQELLTELEEDNKAVLEELNMIRDAINGSENEITTFNDLGIIQSNSSDSYWRLKTICLDYESRYTYTITVTYKNNYDGAIVARALFNNNLLPSNFNKDDYTFDLITLGNVPANSSGYVFTFEVPSTKPKYIYLNWGNFVEKIEVNRSIKGITDSLNQSNSLQQQQNQIQQENNQLQQQQNQLQQEQNNFLQQGTSDSDVSVDSFNNVDSNDITSAGLTGVFNNIYSSISSWNAKNISLPIPYTNKSIVIPANYTENMLSSSGGGWIITFIHAVYYFIVGRFMIYSITNIINSIKSGSILNTDSKNNITTDML